MEIQILPSSSGVADPNSQDKIACPKCFGHVVELKRLLVPADRGDVRGSIIAVLLCECGRSFRLELIQFQNAVHIAKYLSSDRPVLNRLDREHHAVPASV
jgi:hypothetical protein